MINHIHHINFLVHDLDEAVRRYRNLLGETSLVFEDLPQRGVSTARFKVGDTWLVLLQPYDHDNVPGRYLAAHGEGFFLISYAAGDLDEACARLEAEGIGVADPGDRYGLDNWRVRDLDPDGFFGVNVQLTGEPHS